jgi:multisubunit Na+/H+ antiporter MnhF subunit
MNGWLLCAAVLAAALVPLTIAAARRRASDGVVALEVAGLITTAILLLIAEGTDGQSYADLALVLAAVSFIGAIAFLRFLERTR